MQGVSKRWKSNQLQRLRDASWLEVSVIIADPDVLNNAQATDDDSAFFSKTYQVVDGLDKTFRAFSFLERNQWPLDGSRHLLDTSADFGYVSGAVSHYNAAFPTNPTVFTDLDGVVDTLTAGATVIWSTAFNEWATEFTVTVYNGNTIVEQQLVTGNEDVFSVVPMDIINFDSISVTVHQWCMPQRRARIEDILPGVRITYTNNELLGYGQEMTADPLAASLPNYFMEYEVDNVDDSYDPINLLGLSKYLTERQKVVSRTGYVFDGERESILCGTHYLSPPECKAPQNGLSATFVARDWLHFQKNEYTKGVYRPNGISLYDLALEVISDMDIPKNSDGNVNYYLHDDLRNIRTTAPLPIREHANLLQMIANAGACCLSIDRTGRLFITPAAIPSFIGHCEVSDNGHMEFSNPSQIVEPDAVYGQYTMLERNQWTLDGVFTMTYGDTGFIGESLCDDNCEFSVPSIVILTFPKIQAGMVSEVPIVWSEAYGEYAVDFTVRAFNGSVEVASESVADNTEVRCDVIINAQGYDRIEIAVSKWCLPHRRTRLESIPSAPDYLISYFNSHAKPEVKTTETLEGVDVKVYQYFPMSNIELAKQTLSITGTVDIPIKYTGAAANAVATVVGGTLVSASYYSFACVLRVTANGVVDITVSGNQLETSAMVYASNTGLRGKRLPLDNVLVTSTSQAQIVGEWTRDYLSSQQISEFDWRFDPRLDVLDPAMVQNKYGWKANRITSLKCTHDFSWKATGEGRVML